MNKPKRTRKKKEINVSIDTPKVDVEFNKDLDGNIELEIDTPRVDIHAEKTDDKITFEIEINDKETYYFEANGSDGRMKKGAIIKLSGELLKMFLKRGFGKMIKKR